MWHEGKSLTNKLSTSISSHILSSRPASTPGGSSHSDMEGLKCTIPSSTCPMSLDHHTIPAWCPRLWRKQHERPSRMSRDSWQERASREYSGEKNICFDLSCGQLVITRQVVDAWSRPELAIDLSWRRSRE